MQCSRKIMILSFVRLAKSTLWRFLQRSSISISEDYIYRIFPFCGQGQSLKFKGVNHTFLYISQLIYFRTYSLWRKTCSTASATYFFHFPRIIHFFMICFAEQMGRRATTTWVTWIHLALCMLVLRRVRILTWLRSRKCKNKTNLSRDVVLI